jgi:hypothetical protein
VTAPDRTPAPPLGETDLQRIEAAVAETRALAAEVGISADHYDGGLSVVQTDALINSLRAAWAEIERLSLLASVTWSERLAGVEVPPDVAARLLAEQERDEARAERDDYRALLREVYGTHGKPTGRPGYVWVSEELIVRITALLGRDRAPQENRDE